MIHPKKIAIADYTYALPEERIAKYPLEERDASRLLIYHNHTIAEDIYKNINHHIPAGSLLVFNNTRVIEARLLFQKPTGGMIEVFCLEPHEQYADITSAMLQKGKVRWQCLIGGASKWKHQLVLVKQVPYENITLTLFAKFIEKRGGCFIIEFSWEPAELSFAEVLHSTGAIPLPPYIKRKADTSDTERYQTIYAHHSGSVAAPTAGLHFTDTIFTSLVQKNIDTGFVTLHVGAGTFKPVKSETMEDHDMHAEHIDVSADTIANLIEHAGQIVAIGTTSLRTIESLYWLGVKLCREGIAPDSDELYLGQWECYDMDKQDIPVREALQLLLDRMKAMNTERIFAKTRIIIAPGYRFRVASGLVTNFHQPQSTLLLLIAAFAGERWKDLYDYALLHDFRFLSYGDGCLLWTEK